MLTYMKVCSFHKLLLLYFVPLCLHAKQQKLCSLTLLPYVYIINNGNFAPLQQCITCM